MPTLEEILEAKRKAKAKAQASAVVPATVPVQVIPATTSVITEPVQPVQSAETTTEHSKPVPPSQFATSLADKLRSMAQEQDWEDVEQSANSLSEILSVIFALPYPPDVFIDECTDNAASALEAQKNQYLRDVLNGKKQSGRKVKAVQSVTTAAAINSLGSGGSGSSSIDSDDFFVLGM